MKFKPFAGLAGALLCVFVSCLAVAQEAAPVTEAPAAVVEEAAAPAAAEAAAEETAAPAPVPNKGDTAWMMVATLLVILMTVPGLATKTGGST